MTTTVVRHRERATAVERAAAAAVAAFLANARPDPLVVACPACRAEPGTACPGGASHQRRRRRARDYHHHQAEAAGQAAAYIAERQAAGRTAAPAGLSQRQVEAYLTARGWVSGPAGWTHNGGPAYGARRALAIDLGIEGVPR